MQFSFEVDPSLDMAIGMESDFLEAQRNEYATDLEEKKVPLTPTGAKPGSDDKVRKLSARYAAGVPLWHDGDCYDHGPGELGDEVDSMNGVGFGG